MRTLPKGRRSAVLLPREEQAVVGADPVDQPGLERVPQCSLVGLAAQRRATEETMTVRAGEVALVEE